MNSSPNRFLFTFFFQNCLNMLIGLLHFPVQLGRRDTLRAMVAENNHSFHAVRM